MSFGSSFGGIALIALATIWLLVFVPGWAKKSQIASADSAAPSLSSRKLIDRVRTNQLRRLMRTTKVSLFVLLVSLATCLAWFSFPQLALFGIWIPLLCAGGVIGSLLMLMAVYRTRRKIAAMRLEFKQDLQEEIQTSTPKRESFYSKYQGDEADSGWQPNPLPRPLSAAKIGALITSPVADVIPIKSQEDDSESMKRLHAIELDEILRRRRAI